MGGIEAAMLSGAGHLTSFVGTDTVPAIAALEKYYNADIEKELVGTSIPATEHSVMCAGGKETELNTYRRLITEVYPDGFISIVSDTWDLWNTITNILPQLKDEIMARDGKVVIRPDSGDPVDIICGEDRFDSREQFEEQKDLECLPEDKGVIELLWDIFGGTTNDLGFKELDPHIGCIYGDSITPERCEEICKRLNVKGFASTNMVYGIGSYTYQYNTRDTFGFAMKSTCCVVNGEERMIFKDPVTDDGTKKSNTGCVAVLDDAVGSIACIDELPLSAEVEGDKLRTIFKDGEMIIDDSLAQIRERLV
jgi:nicotinamide phosphoribosyltransferase